MSNKPSIAFKADTDRERTISKRLHRHAETLSRLQGLPGTAGRTIARVAAGLRQDAASYHPTTQRYGTLSGAGGTRIALIDSISAAGYRLLPCSEAGTRSIKARETAHRYRVDEWPTIQLAVAYAKAVDAINQRIRKVEKARERQQAPLRRQKEKLKERLRDRAKKHQQREAGKAATP